MTTPMPLTGATTLMFRDQAIGGLVAGRKFIGAMISIMLVIELWLSLPYIWPRYMQAPFGTLIGVGSLWVLFNLIILSLGAVAGRLIVSALAWRKLNPAQRQISYTIDDRRIVTCDALESELIIPWTIVTRVHRTKHLLLLKINTGAWRCLPWRAFRSCDQARLWQIAQCRSAQTR